MQQLFVYPYLLQGSLFGVFSTGTLVIIYAIFSAKNIGGQLGAGLKKVAAGVVCYVGLFFTLLVLESQNGVFLSPEQIRIFFLLTSMLGSILMIAGFTQIYQIGKRLKLFY